MMTNAFNRTCPKCHRIFYDASAKWHHLKRRACDKTNICVLCAASYKPKAPTGKGLYCPSCQPLAKKIRTQKCKETCRLNRNAPNPQQCEICKKWYKNKHSLGGHKTKCFPSFSCIDETFKCPYCDKEFKSNKALSGHYKGCIYLVGEKVLRPPANPVKPCITCGATGFYKESAYCAECYKIAFKNRLIQCGKCDFSFKIQSGVGGANSNFARHSRSCLGPKCRACGINNRFSFLSRYCKSCTEKHKLLQVTKWKARNPDKIRASALKFKQNKTLQELTNFIQGASAHGL